nr:MAG TPA: minor capsid protein [Caudoviricetes sp.]
MNRWEIEVQKSLLDSEEAALKELEKQYGKALKDINEKVKGFQADIDLLDQALSQDGLDETARAMLQSQKRSKIYQQNYQRALQGQVSGILDKMHGDNYGAIDKYLNGCYETGYVGTMYSIAGQGVPLVIPVDQAAAVKAVLTDSKVSNGLYNALGVNVKKLKKTITQEISRGIASSLPYSDIARNISSVSKAPLSRAKTIARTEGHRIQQTSARDAQYAAKKKGADVVKQWDAALDGRTRDSHARVDGEIRELDEKFSNGLKYPGDPSGGAAEVVNCRCTANTRARWALDDEELQTLKERAEYFGLDKTENFEDFKQKYLKAAETPIAQVNTFTPAKTIEDAAKFAKETLGLEQTTAYQLGMNLDVANGLNEAIGRMSDTFGSLTEAGYLENVLLFTNRSSNSYAAYSDSLRTVFLNPVVKQKGALKKMAKDAVEQFEPGAWSTGSAFHTVYHELGHAVQHMILDNNALKKNKIDVLYRKTFSDILGAETTWTIDKDTAALAKKTKEAGFSYYGLRNSGEFVAESIAQYYLSDKPGEIAKQVVEILKGK